MSAGAISPPRTVRLAGVLTTVEAIIGLVFVVALLVRAGTGDLGGVGTFDRGQTYGEAGYFGLLSVGVLAAGIGLWKGKHWARTPSLLLQLLLLGVAWYALGPSGRPLIGAGIAALPVVILWSLFNRGARVWTMRTSEAPDADVEPR